MIIDTIFRYIDLWAKDKEIYSKVGKVVSVDEDERSIEFEPIEGGNLEDVRLQAAISTVSGFVQIPSVDSKVIVTFINETQAFVSLCTEVDKILIDTDLVQFNGGGNDGLININDLVDKLNDLVSEVSSLNSAYKAHTHTAPSGATGTPVPPFTGSISIFNKADFEDDKITH
jgi:hypothetical protein